MSDATEDPWTPWWEWCPQKNYLSYPPDFSGLDPDTGEPWSPKKIVEMKGLKIHDSSDLQRVCETVIQNHPKEVELYRKGKTKVMGAFIKGALQETQGGADPRAAKEIFEQLLKT